MTMKNVRSNLDFYTLDDARHEALIAYELYKLGKFRV